jgi:thiol-disulfide isomerase/thioredoxin
LVFVALGGLFAIAWTQRKHFVPADLSARAPEFAGTTLTGEHFSIAASRGKVIVLNVWATWCTPCVREMPALERLYQRLRADGLVVVAVSTDAGPGVPGLMGQPGGDVRAFVAHYGLTFPVIHDARRTIEPLYLVHGLPTTYIIDRKGRIDRKAVGGRSWDDEAHVAYFERLLKE